MNFLYSFVCDKYIVTLIVTQLQFSVKDASHRGGERSWRWCLWWPACVSFWVWWSPAEFCRLCCRPCFNFATKQAAGECRFYLRLLKFTVATHLENLENREMSANLRVVREKSGKVCSCIWSITASIDLDIKCAKKVKVVHHMKSERRKNGYSASCKLCLTTFSLSNMGKQANIIRYWPLLGAFLGSF